MINKQETIQSRIVSGSVILLSGSGLTAVLNFAYNVSVARFLGATGYGHATVVYTLLTLLSAATLSFQIISAKAVAQHSTPEGKAAVYRAFHRGAWVCGLLAALALVRFQSAIAGYLNLPSPDLVALIALGAAFYVPLGSRRGYIQGTCGFVRLAGNLVLEGAARFGGSLLCVMLGWGVRGVVEANAAAIAIAYICAASRLAPRVPNPLGQSHTLRELSQAIVFFSGQVLINNCDIGLVKHFFPANAAGLYAAVAMAGRMIFSFSSAVVNSTFPIVAGSRDEQRRDLRVIATSLMLVIGAGSTVAAVLFIAPAWIWKALFGAGFDAAGGYSISYLFALYALNAVVYSLSAVIITFEMSYKIANTSWIQLLFSGVIIAGICRFHSSLREVILVQLVLLVVLFILVALPFLVSSLSDSRSYFVTGICRPVRLIRRVSEDEVIAEFLKSDFHCHAYRNYQQSLRPMVVNPNLEDDGENAVRRALLLIRHFALWKEIPSGTEWHEVEVNTDDLYDIRVFPRAQWRKLARGNYSIVEVAESIRERRHALDSEFLAKIASIGDQFVREDCGLGAVILIGRNETEPLTVLDGNHRLAAAIFRSPNNLGKLRFLCGLSPRMTDCCWYHSNLANLFRYGRSVIKQAIHSPEAELQRMLDSTSATSCAVLETSPGTNA